MTHHIPNEEIEFLDNGKIRINKLTSLGDTPLVLRPIKKAEEQETIYPLMIEDVK